MEKQRIKQLVEVLNKASRAYYTEDKEIMSNFEYDTLFDELKALEMTTGIVLPDSPTQRVGYEVVSKLKKVEHNSPALSLDKTKSVDEMLKWLGNQIGVLSWKMDGLTIVATYRDGNLVSAVTRGNGYVGEDVTHNASFFRGLPQRIAFKEELIVRGEATMTMKEFDRINSLIVDADSKYKNARNLASATVRLLDSKEASKREITFTLFELGRITGKSFETIADEFDFLAMQGFNVVEHVVVDKNSLPKTIEIFQRKIIENEFPSDGLVTVFNDVEYGKSLGHTGHHFRNGLAFKWQDEEVETILRKIEWSASRTGLLNPVAVFDSVDLDGTSVSRASTHNVSITRALNLGLGSTIKVYKANMIIPQISETVKSTGPSVIPDKCPICGGNTKIHINEDVETLYCINPNCQAKHIGAYTHFVGRNAMNIDGLSEATLEKFVDCGFIHEFADIYHLQNFRDEIISMEGFGEKSYNKLIEAIENSRNVKFANFLNALGISGVGKDMANQISKAMGNEPFYTFVDKLRNCEDFSMVEGIGEVINSNIYAWKANIKNREAFANLVDELTFIDEAVKEADSSNAMYGKTFVITGSLEHYANRDELKEFIESVGGKVSGSVSAKTSYLINNDVTSASGKNKKAKELGIPIISEKEFISNFI